MPNEDGVVSSDDSLTPEQMEAALKGDLEPAPANTESAKSEPKADSTPEPKKDEHHESAAAQPGDKPAEPDAFKKELDALKRAAGKVPALESRLAEVSKLLHAQDEARRRDAEAQRQRALEALGPEQRQQAEQAERWLFETLGVTRDQLNELRQRDQLRAQNEQVQAAEGSIRSFVQQAQQLAGKDWPTLEPIIDGLYNEKLGQAQAGDAAAQAWLQNFYAHPSFGILEATRMQALGAAQQAAQGQAAVAQAKRAVAPATAGAAVSTAPDKFAPENLDNLTVEDLPALEAEMRRRGML